MLLALVRARNKLARDLRLINSKCKEITSLTTEYHGNKCTVEQFLKTSTCFTLDLSCLINK
ncbi:hypothetical protein T12_1742 [Trichinella patagoniensis]|uniref:Uncharacterized protein n=1 Tax=Trichinella patagoniensis TaxID=990121 RepID=A0A0V0ZM21_9BILA|nr:hypothetical protein T12_1742 [Trichinella patagoniensis]